MKTVEPMRMEVEKWRNLLRPFTGKKQDWIEKRFKRIDFVEDLPLLKKEDILVSSPLDGLDPYTRKPNQYSLKTNFFQLFPNSNIYQYDLYDVIRDEQGALWWTDRDFQEPNWSYPHYSDPISGYHSRHNGYDFSEIIRRGNPIYIYTADTVQEFINWCDVNPLEVKG